MSMAFKFNSQFIPLRSGVYIFRDKNGKPLYVGKAVNLKQRVSSYFQKGIKLLDRTKLMVGQIAEIETIKTETELEALLLEADLIKRLKPKYNVAWKDDKHYKYIKIFLKPASGGWPYVTTSRKTDDKTAIYFGPFPEGRTVNEVLRSLRRVFPWCKYKNATEVKRGHDEKRGCFYYQIALCPGVCASLISLEEYQAIIDNLIRVLLGKSKVVVKGWEKKMRQAVKNQNFEVAAKYRDLIQKLHYVTQAFHDSSEYLENPNLLEDQRRQEIESLVGTLQPYFSNLQSPISNLRIEAYDISNLQGQFAVGAKVAFTGSEPQKSDYRRYKIRLNKNQLPNDVAAIKEILFRRFKDFSGFKPNLILIDGGKTQVSAALEILQRLNLKIPVIGLAKKLEEIVIPVGFDSNHKPSYKILHLPKSSPALKFLQRMRDEVHRFAISYHRKLRAKAMVEKKS